MNILSKRKLVKERQIEFGKRVGLDLHVCSENVAIAKLQDLIDVEFWGLLDLGAPTPKQIRFAKDFGFDISNDTKRVAHAVIDDIMDQLNLDAITKEELAPGVSVINIWDKLRNVFVISSIRDDGIVFFKGGNGKKAWARNLRRADSPPED